MLYVHIPHQGVSSSILIVLPYSFGSKTSGSVMVTLLLCDGGQLCSMKDGNIIASPLLIYNLAASFHSSIIAGRKAFRIDLHG